MKLRNLLFERSGGHWLFWCSAIYLALGLYCALYYKEVPAAVPQLVWLAVLAGPLLIPPLGRWLNMSIEWDKRMFNFFGKKKNSNVIKFPEVPPIPQVVPPEPPKEEPAKTYYRLGLTDNNRVSFYMGYSEITMNAAGVQQLIDQLAFYKDQLREESDE